MGRTKGKPRLELITYLKDKLPQELLSMISHRWWKIGDILIIPIPQKLESFKQEIGKALLEMKGKKIRTVLGKIGGTEDIFRTPMFEYLAGDENTETLHKELGCIFKLDAMKITFSPGNHGERKRLITITKDGEFIIDMFSCVGNLSLPLAVHKNPMQIIATEINPIAYKYLQENIRLNNVSDRMKAILGDNRIVLNNYIGKADRVLSGYLHSDEKQLKLALNLCKKNGVLHYHEAVPIKKELKNQTQLKILNAAKVENHEAEIINIKRVKKYSPGTEHIVVDIKVF